MIWIVLAVLTAGVVYVLSQPLTREASNAADDATDTAVYKDQLTEIETDRARGLISAEDAEAARAEVARRILQTHETAATAATPVSQPSSNIFERALLLVPIGAMALYVWLGSPNLPSVPLATRAPPPQADAGIGELIKRVEAQLKATPNDGRGWEVIAPIYLKLQRYDQASYAFSQSIRLNGETTDRLRGFAEADMLGNKGVVSDAVKKAAERIVALEPKTIDAKIWLILAKEQGGDVAGAIADYEKLLADAPAGAPWREPVEAQIKKLKHLAPVAAGAPPPAVVPAPMTPPLSAQNPAVSSPEAIAALPEDERQKMIEGMVGKLAARLKENGNDLGGWQRLIRAYQVMGRKDDAIGALASARKQFAADQKALADINAVAAEVGLN